MSDFRTQRILTCTVTTGVIDSNRVDVTADKINNYGNYHEGIRLFHDQLPHSTCFSYQTDSTSGGQEEPAEECILFKFNLCLATKSVCQFQNLR